MKKKILSYNDYKVKCSIGKRGITFNKKEGDLKTPKGIFKIKEIFYRRDRVKKFSTNLKKKIIRKNMGWCDDSKSKHYNKLIKFPFKFKAEKLYRKDNIYDVVIVLNFNMNPIVKNKGSAIFLHVSKKNFASTKGCIAISKKEIRRIVKHIDKNTKVKIV